MAARTVRRGFLAMAVGLLGALLVALSLAAPREALAEKEFVTYG